MKIIFKYFTLSAHMIKNIITYNLFNKKYLKYLKYLKDIFKIFISELYKLTIFEIGSYFNL